MTTGLLQQSQSFHKNLTKVLLVILRLKKFLKTHAKDGSLKLFG